MKEWAVGELGGAMKRAMNGAETECLCTVIFKNKLVQIKINSQSINYL